MAVDPRSVKISSPCPTTLDPDRHKDGKSSFHCGHCDKSVHVLSNMTEAEARQLMVDKKGSDICISYAIKPDGEVRFREPPPPPPGKIVPVSALSRRMGGRAAAAAAVGFSAALAACTPHEKDSGDQKPPVVVEEPDVEHEVGKMEVAPETPEDEPEDEIVKGEMAPIDEPCETPKDDATADTLVDGGIKAMPEPDEIPKPGGMVAEPFPE